MPRGPTIKSVSAEIRRLAGDCAINRTELLRVCGKHPDAEGAVAVEINEETTNGLGLMFRYPNGGVKPFSINHAAKHFLGRPVVDNHRTNLMAALRNEVWEQTHGFRVQEGCSGRTDLHVDHDEVKFRDIAREWLELTPTAEYEWRRGGFRHEQCFLKDPRHARSWRVYHEGRARLRMLTAEENLRLG